MSAPRVSRECPDECPTCGCDLKYEGHPERHQDARDGSECSWSWGSDAGEWSWE